MNKQLHTLTYSFSRDSMLRRPRFDFKALEQKIIPSCAWYQTDQFTMPILPDTLSFREISFRLIHVDGYEDREFKSYLVAAASSLLCAHKRTTLS
jgi:hypothetical protein